MTDVLIADIAVVAPLERPLSYLVPPELAAAVQPGMRLRVPLGKRQALGVALALRTGPGAGLKPVLAALDEAPLLDPPLLALLQRAADYYAHPLGEVLRHALPGGLSRLQSGTGVVTETCCFPTAADGEPTGARQRALLARIRRQPGITTTDLRQDLPSGLAPLRRLEELGLIQCRSRERYRDSLAATPAAPNPPLELADEQQAALDALTAALNGGGFRPALLQGVTGSGKTEVYLRLIEAALAAGGQALVLVPEIGLTPQLVARFRGRFPAVSLAVLHSGLADGERFDAWRRIARGEADLVIGVRSAVFAPLPRLKVIVVDEEHDASYKQGEGFRYHGRDLALLRGQMAGALVLLGSATPALTTYAHACDGRYLHLRLTGRAEARPLPAVEIVDLAAQPPTDGLSEPLRTALAETLAKGEQALLLLNRRGFSPFLLCADCGHTPRCPNCAITLTWHRQAGVLRCHYCDYRQPPLDLCPQCGGHNLQPEGAGTERLEAALAESFPEARIGRMDRDATSGKGAHGRLVERMLAGELDILVGTQMVAKGHDFPRVTLVGVILADSGLNFPDFRAAERTFALLAQAAGRAGRAERPGRVLIQTWSPDHYAVLRAAQHDVDGFLAEERAFREPLAYPPFGHLVNLVLAGNDADRTARAAEELASGLRALAGPVEILGPSPCPLARLRGKSRWQLLLKAASRPALRALLAQRADWGGRMPAGVALALDVDPLDML